MQQLFYYSFKMMNSFKNKSKACLRSGVKGMFTQFRRYSPNSKCRPSSCILAVLAMFLGSSLVIVFFFVNRLKCSAFFSNTTQPCPPGSSVAFHFSVIYAVLLTSFSTQQILNVFQLWSMLVGYSLVS